MMSLYDIIADLHTHTLYSHGKGTILSNVEAARGKGLKKIAITDHGFRHLGYGVSRDDIYKMKTEIDGINGMYDDIEVLLGVETNLIGLDGTVDLKDEDLDLFDIILMGFHHGAIPKSIRDVWGLYGRNVMGKIVPSMAQAMRYDNTMAMIKAMERYPIDIITHPGAKIDIDSHLLARHAAKHNVALEINAGHGYMTVDYVKIAMEEGALFAINSDAHTPEKVGDFARALDIAKEAGLEPSKIINSSKFESD